MSDPLISVVIPAFNETAYLATLLESLKDEEGIEVIVSLPSGDQVSASAASPFNVQVLEGDAGRGAQMHLGAQKSKGDILLFCHADTILPSRWKELIWGALAQPSVIGGAFRLKIGSSQFGYGLIAFFANIRASWLGLVYGDQAIFTTREAYLKLGGYRPLPLMEDVDFFRRMRKLSKVVLLNESVTTSPRRWESEGAIYGVCRNAVLIVLYLLGVSPVTMSAWYSR